MTPFLSVGACVKLDTPSRFSANSSSGQAVSALRLKILLYLLFHVDILTHSIMPCASLSLAFGSHPPVVILAQVHIPGPDLPKLWVCWLDKHLNVHRLFKNEVSKVEFIVFFLISVFPSPCVPSRNLASPDLSSPLHPKGYNTLTVLPLDGSQVSSWDPITLTAFRTKSGSPQSCPCSFLAAARVHPQICPDHLTSLLKTSIALRLPVESSLDST